jgi:hypothetical protein
MSETPSGDEELETADDDADQVSETSAGDDAALGLCNYGGLIDPLFTDVEGVA